MRKTFEYERTMEEAATEPGITPAATTTTSSIDEGIASLMDHFYSLMGKWYFWRAAKLSSRLQTVQCHGGQGQYTRSTGSGARTTSSSATVGKDCARGNPSNQPLVVPERRIPRDDEDDDSDDERQHKKPKLKDSDSETQRLACPYFKRNPSFYRHWRSCPGPGWGTVHRVKCDSIFFFSCFVKQGEGGSLLLLTSRNREHLYRCHLLPPSCPRCHETFESEKVKLEHLISSERCAVRDKPRIEGIDPATHELLRSRKLLQGQETEVAKWQTVYLALFPDVKEHDILPSPCQ